MNTPHFFDDIPRDIAYRANLGTSFVPEQRGETERNEYASTLAADFEMLLKHAPTDETQAILETEFARYRDGYKSRSLAYLHSKGRCLSSMIGCWQAYRNSRSLEQAGQFVAEPNESSAP
jgi:hypothetical protein